MAIILKLTDEDIAWIRAYYPSLRFRRSGIREIVEGSFEFTAAYDELRQQYLIHPDDVLNPKIMVIQDKYEIRITPPRLDAKLPMVQETGGRIRNVAKERGLATIDLHLYPNNAVCLVGPLYDEPVQSFPDFLYGPVLQFFYDQSYFEKFGRWPRGAYSHGIPGVLENYLEQRECRNGRLIKRCLGKLMRSHDWPKVRHLLMGKESAMAHCACFCGSNREFRDCHSQALKGLRKLQEDMRSTRICLEGFLSF